MFANTNLFTSSQSGHNFTNLTPTKEEAAAKKGGRQEERLTCLPATVRTVETAIANQAAEKGEVTFFGEEQGMLVLVGFVESVAMQATSLELSFNDTTGRIKARHYMAEVTPELESVKPGSYVSLVGAVRTSPEPHFAANGVRLVTSADEVSYHMIEAAHAALKLQRVNKDGPMTPAPKKAQQTSADAMAVDISPPKATEQALPFSAPAPAMASKGALEGEALRQAILAHLRREGEGQEQGLPLANFSGHLAPTESEAIKRALEQLVEDGELYHPLDEEHWAVL